MMGHPEYMYLYVSEWRKRVRRRRIRKAAKIVAVVFVVIAMGVIW